MIEDFTKNFMKEVSEEIKAERERIKAVVEEQIEKKIEHKQENIKFDFRRKHQLSFTEVRRIKEKIFFWIDNPDYERKGPASPEAKDL